MLNLTSARLRCFSIAAGMVTSACSGMGMQNTSSGSPPAATTRPSTQPATVRHVRSMTTGGFTLTDLGAISGDLNSRALGIGPNGQAAGESDGTTAAEATLFANGAATNINTLGASVSEGQGVNGNNQVTGFADVSAGRHAFLYSNGVMTDINDSTIFPGGSIGYGINRTGQVVGEGFINTTLTPGHAFLYSNGQMVDLTPGANAAGIAFSINDSGQIVGNGTLPGGKYAPFLYQNGNFTDLSGCIGPRYINNTGQIVGNNGSDAELYSNGVCTDLGVVSGASSAIALGVNSASQIVGTARFPNQYYPFRPGKHVAFIVHNGNLVDLNKMLSGNVGYTMTDANGINDSGQIAGIATNSSGQPRAMLLTPKQ